MARGSALGNYYYRDKILGLGSTAAFKGQRKPSALTHARGSTDGLFPTLLDRERGRSELFFSHAQGMEEAE